LTKIDAIIDSNVDDILSDLQDLIKQPSVSTRKQALTECAYLVASIMKKGGISAEVLYLDNSSNNITSDNCNKDKTITSSSAPPIVFGEVKSKANPDGKTILFYNHYDVQPEEPIELWKADPFSGIIEGNHIFGRGSTDNKGELITRIKAVEYFLKETGDIPCNVKFIVEGEEEIGSMNIEKYLLLYGKKLEADLVIWEFGSIDEKDRPILELGVKGILSVEIISKGPSYDIHSGLAALIENPAWQLIKILNSLRADNGQVLIKDWYKELRGFTNSELMALENESIDEEELRKE
jgi:acetylornithine deacetylase/succinyl-diaminopimelate desuccinylase-like protein